MKIRPATVNDKEQIFELVKRNWHDNFSDCVSYVYSTETCEGYLTALNKFFDKYHLFLVADENEKIVGFATLYDNSGRPFLAEIFVDKNYQKKGVGSTLVKEIIKNTDNVYTGINENNKASQSFFSKCGFKKVVTSSIWKKA